MGYETEEIKIRGTIYVNCRDNGFDIEGLLESKASKLEELLQIVADKFIKDEIESLGIKSYSGEEAFIYHNISVY